MVMDQVHNGICGTHMNGCMLAQKIIHLRYYWTTIEKDYYLYAKPVQNVNYALICNISHPHYYTFNSPWPISTRGINIIGKITLPGTEGYEFILVAIDYFIKWVK